MYKSLAVAIALATTALASTAAYADDAPASPITVTGSVDLTTQYRLRGISQTDNDAAIQGGITIAHSSGLYVSTWASNLAGAGDFGGAHMELDLIGGYSKAVGPVTLDGGFIYYAYPGVNKPYNVDYYEIYGSVSGKVGPANAKLGAYWAPSQSHIAWSGSKGHNVWIYTDWGLPISGTPFTLKAHAGYSDGNSSYTRSAGHIFDYGVGVDATYKNLTLNVSYVGTDVGRADSLDWDGGSETGRAITKGNVVATLTAAF